MNMILVTGGAGFIGSNFVIDWIAKSNQPVINLDKLTYAGNLKNLLFLNNNTNHIFVKGDIADNKLVSKLLYQYSPYAIINFAAETHVDRSIFEPKKFVQTNIIGTYNFLETTYAYWKKLDDSKKLINGNIILDLGLCL